MDFNKIIDTTAKDVKTLTFTQAIQFLSRNTFCKVHKLEWEDKNYYAVLNNGTLHLHKPDGKFYNWIISEGDMSGEDYIIL